MLKPKGSIDTRQFAAAFVTQVPVTERRGRKLGCAVSVWLFCDVLGPISTILTDLSQTCYNPKNPVRRIHQKQLKEATGKLVKKLRKEASTFRR